MKKKVNINWAMVRVYVLTALVTALVAKSGSGWYAALVPALMAYVHFSGFTTGMKMGLALGKRAFDQLNEAVDHLVSDIKAEAEAAFSADQK